jgi:hypothetical protein
MDKLVAFQVPVKYYKEPVWIWDPCVQIEEIDNKNSKIHLLNMPPIIVPLSKKAIIQRKNQALCLLALLQQIQLRKHLYTIMLQTT